MAGMTCLESMFSGWKIDRMSRIELSFVGKLLKIEVNPNQAKELCLVQIRGALVEFEHNWKAQNLIDTTGKDKDKDQGKKDKIPDKAPDDPDEGDDEDPDDEDEDDDDEEEELYPPVVVFFCN
jgi:hypothetical protein